MVVFHIRSFKKKAALWAAGLVLVVVALVLILSGCLHKKPAATDFQSGTVATNEDRVAYLLRLGWEVQPEMVETLHLMLPSPLPPSYDEYESRQVAQGLSLAAGCGKQIMRCTYVVTNYPGRPDGVQVNLYLCDDVVIAGDIVVLGDEGFEAGLAFPESA